LGQGAKKRLAEDFDFDECGALLDEVEGVGGGVRKVDDAVGGFGAVIVDGDADRFPVAEIGDAKFCAAGKFWMGGGEFIGRVGAAAGGLMALERRTVERGITALGFGFFGGRFWRGVFGGLGECGECKQEQTANGEMAGFHFARVSRGRGAGERKLHWIGRKDKERTNVRERRKTQALKGEEGGRRAGPVARRRSQLAAGKPQAADFARDD
jgi:hypothetical protein